MAREAQVAANPRVAARSTGPRTADGEAMSARNALTHGPTAEHLACRDEAGEVEVPRAANGAAGAAGETKPLPGGDAVAPSGRAAARLGHLPLADEGRVQVYGTKPIAAAPVALPASAMFTAIDLTVLRAHGEHGGSETKPMAVVPG